MTATPGFRILGETEELLAVGKPAGLIVHPSKPGGPRTLWDELRGLLGYEIANGGQVSLINRLDRETSGVVLVAKTAQAARRAAMAMQEGRIRKRYVALTSGVTPLAFTCEGPILRQGEVEPSRVYLKRCVHPRGAPARTIFRRLAIHRRDGALFSLVEAEPLTGRTHQIRVHLSHAGYPVLGDKLYGPSDQIYLDFVERGLTPELEKALGFPRHALHSSALEIEWDGAPLKWECPLPSDMAGFLETSELVSRG